MESERKVEAAHISRLQIKEIECPEMPPSCLGIDNCVWLFPFKTVRAGSVFTFTNRLTLNRN